MNEKFVFTEAELAELDARWVPDPVEQERNRIARAYSHRAVRRRNSARLHTQVLMAWAVALSAWAAILALLVG